MRVLGVDPGFGITGWAIVDYDLKDNINLVDFGVITTTKEQTFSSRLAELYSDISQIIGEYKPGYAGVETLLFYNNAKTAINVGQARGVVLLALEQNMVPLFEITPLQVKNSISGYGQATKLQVQENVKMICGLDEIPRPDDAADAVAVAICCYDHVRGSGMVV